MDLKEQKLFKNCGNLEVLNLRGISYDGGSRAEDIPEIEKLIYKIDWTWQNKNVMDRLKELGVTRVINHEERKALDI